LTAAWMNSSGGVFGNVVGASVIRFKNDSPPRVWRGPSYMNGLHKIPRPSRPS
jgi:hypothetical protein